MSLPKGFAYAGFGKFAAWFKSQVPVFSGAATQANKFDELLFRVTRPKPVKPTASAGRVCAPSCFQEFCICRFWYFAACFKSREKLDVAKLIINSIVELPQFPEDWLLDDP